MWAVDWWVMVLWEFVTPEGPPGSAGAQDVRASHGTFPKRSVPWSCP